MPQRWAARGAERLAPPGAQSANANNGSKTPVQAMQSGRSSCPSSVAEVVWPQFPAQPPLATTRCLTEQPLRGNQRDPMWQLPPTSNAAKPLSESKGRSRLEAAFQPLHATGRSRPASVISPQAVMRQSGVVWCQQRLLLVLAIRRKIAQQMTTKVCQIFPSCYVNMCVSARGRAGT